MNGSRFYRCWQLLRFFGPQWLMYRAYHAARMQSGLMRHQLPTTTWGEQPLSAFLFDRSLGDCERYFHYRKTSSPKFFFDPDSMKNFQPYFAEWDAKKSSPLVVADAVRRGFVQFFSHELIDVGFPPNWHADPFTGHSFPSDRHWSQIGDFSAGDIKLVWEANRFGFVFPLVRAYWRTGDEQYAQLFWQLVESWHAANPPEAGVNWKCGQEISLRVMAWCFGLYGFGASAASTPIRVAMLAQMIAVSGVRIESNIGYALSQKNNHGLSEAMGLWTIGSLFPEFRDAARWAESGRLLLERQALELIYDDGAFSQHSMNYHRVMLHDYLWSIRLGDLQGRSFSTKLRERIARAGDFVYQLQDELTGQVPCYGQDDGALVLPLNDGDYQDYRPVVQAAHFLTSGQRKFAAGHWDEDLLWLFGVQAIPQTGDQRANDVGIQNPSFVARERPLTLTLSPEYRGEGTGGYFTLRSVRGFAMTRAATFRHRPAQADMLHVDIWWRGMNIAIDPGTYAYNAQPPWNNALAQTCYHNTVTVDGVDQMDRASRFLWLPWLNGKSFGGDVPCRGDVACWNGEHDGYRRLPDPVTHRRGLVRLGSDHWLVVDSLRGRTPHSFLLHWLLLDVPFHSDIANKTVELRTAEGNYRVAMSASTSASSFAITRAATDSAVGWRSRFYHNREPAIAVRLEASASQVVFATVLGPDALPVVIAGDRVQVTGTDWDVEVSLNLLPSSGVNLVSSVQASGSLLSDFLSVANLSHSPVLESHQCTSC